MALPLDLPVVSGGVEIFTRRRSLMLSIKGDVEFDFIERKFFPFPEANQILIIRERPSTSKGKSASGGDRFLASSSFLVT